jgi:D-2-hydroxyacid dehydrogenase (NADP+)
VPTLLVHPEMPLGIDGSRLRGRRGGLTVRRPGDRAAFRAAVGDADVLLVSNAAWEDAYLEGLDAGDFVQSMSAGYDAFPVDAIRDRGVAFARGTVHGPAAAEHAMALALGLLRGLGTFRDRQRAGEWDRSPGRTLGSLVDRTLTVVGLGGIGRGVVGRARAFDARVEAVTRHPGEHDALPADRIHALADLDAILPETDALVLAVPLTDRTRGLIDADALAALPATAVLVNVARGEVIDADALVDALRAEEGGVAGAGLDVFATEPLPADSPLWDLEDALLTPHVAVHSRWYADRVVDRCLENYDRWRRGESLHGAVVDADRTA